MPGISPDLYHELQETLITTRYFDTPQSLHNLFIDNRIYPWRYRWRTADSVADQVGAIIVYLYENYSQAGENALALFLRVLSEQIDPHDACHHKLLRLADKLSQTAEIELAHQMRGWFNAVNYRISQELHNKSDYFEWLIEEQISKRRYNRVVVRGVAGEGNQFHFQALAEAVKTHQADQGWLVAVRRIAPSVRKQCTECLQAYTFDELLDEKADFDSYIAWLEKEIKTKQIDSHYVSLGSHKIDHVGDKAYQESYEDIDRYLNEWLDDPTKEHVSILGEFGTGKTWLSLHYAWVALQRYQQAKAEGMKRPRLPLVILLRDHAKKVSVESLFLEFIRTHDIGLPRYTAFEQLNRMGKLLLIFDGFDEMADRIDRQKMINNFWELARVVVLGSKVILTSRTEHFPHSAESRNLFKAELPASTQPKMDEKPQFEILELQKFDEAQIKQVLSFYATPQTVEKILANKELRDLAQRPVMIGLILEALPDIEAGKPIDLARIYLYAVSHQLDKINTTRSFTSTADKLYFMCELSWEMLSTDQMTLNYRAFPDHVRQLFGTRVLEQKDIDHWDYDMRGQTMLIRNEDGDYTPAHRSLLEFFVAYKCAAELGVLADDFVALARKHQNIDPTLPTQEYVWSDYFTREMTSDGKLKTIAPLSSFVPKDITRIIETLGQFELARAIIDLLRTMLGSKQRSVEEILIGQIQATRNMITNDVAKVNRNIIAILLRYNRLALKHQDLSNVNLMKTRFIGNLTYCNLSKTNLSGANFNDAIMKYANLQNTDLHNITLFSGYITIMSDTYFFWYPNMKTHDKPKLSFEIQDNEVVVGRVDDERLRWTYILQTTFIIKYTLYKKRLYLMTIEGERVTLDTETGLALPIDDDFPLEGFQTWKDADFTGAIGLDEKTIYRLKLLGAINLPETSYDPRSDSSWKHPRTRPRPT